MRGVCALNMEAMSVLLKNDNESEISNTNNDEQQQQHRRYCHRKKFSIRIFDYLKTFERRKN